MSIAATTLNGAKALNDTFLNIATTTGMVRGKMFQIDNEFYRQSADAVGTSVPVLCGQESAQVAHAAGTQVFWGDPADFPSAPAGTEVQVPFSPTVVHLTHVTATGATISVPLSKQGAFIELLGSVTTAQKIKDPTLAQEGQVVTIQAGAILVGDIWAAYVRPGGPLTEMDTVAPPAPAIELQAPVESANGIAKRSKGGRRAGLSRKTVLPGSEN